MHPEASLIATISIGLAYAFIGGFAASRLHLPPLVGYLLAGVAVGPFTPGFIADAAVSSQLAEIGVILLMFGVGMHFSVRDLWTVGSIALPGAIGQVVVATALGASVAYFWGWSVGAGLVFGLSLSVASTVVLLKGLEASKPFNRSDGHIAVGWTIVEDLVIVLVLVLLPAFASHLGGAASAHDSSPDGGIWVSAALTLGKVALFVTLMLVVGRRFFPWLMQRVECTNSRELFTLIVVALALGVAFSSAKLFGVSLALGAFFAGVVIKESHLSDRAAADLQPLQDAFGVLFFVAIGMLFDPMILLRQPLQVLAVLAIIVIGKSLAAFGILLALGRPVTTALAVSAALAQIGELSFILAALGRNLGVLPNDAQSLIVAGALLSISLNPWVVRAASALARGTRFRYFFNFLPAHETN